jgi:hypothetical protein
MLGNLGRALLASGEIAGARDMLREGLELGARIRNQWYITVSLEGLAGVAAVERRHEAAVTLFAAMEALAGAGEVVLPASDRAINAEFLAPARSALSEAAYAAAVQRGRSWNLESAMAAALEDTDVDSGPVFTAGMGLPVLRLTPGS